MSQAVETVRVALGERSYAITIGAEILAEVAPRISALPRVTHAVIVTDDHVEHPHGTAVAQAVAALDDVKVEIISIEPGEESKSVDMAADLWQALLDLGADRQTLVVAVGGGVIGDLAGFVAATFTRGLRFFQVPTSLLAQVDSSVGGKVGINLPEAKNMVGAFHQPCGVLIDTCTLATLPEREYRSGLAEVVKYGVIMDAAFFADLEANVEPLLARDPQALTRIIARCCRLKADVVEADEFERSGRRAILNYGHTFAHAFESLCGYGTLLHGEAVAIGMLCAARLAHRLGRIDESLLARQQRLLSALGLPTCVPKESAAEVTAPKVLDAMLHDKKVAHGRLRFVLPVALGRVELVADVDPQEAAAALENPSI